MTSSSSRAQERNPSKAFVIMAHSQSILTKTSASVEKARIEVNQFKQQIRQLLSTQPEATNSSINQTLMKHVSHFESLVDKAETTVRRIRNPLRVPPRPTASYPPSIRAKRALAVLADSSNVSGRLVAGIKDDELTNVLRRIGKETDLIVRRVINGGVGFECKNVFRAFMWFRSKNQTLTPIHIACFRIDEVTAGRWSISKHAVFNVFTERANAALRYFQASEKSGADALIALAKWLVLHKSLFRDRAEERRLAFDASRGIFLPACVTSFDGRVVRFTRGTIPVRHSSAQPTVRVPVEKTIMKR